MRKRMIERGGAFIALAWVLSATSGMTIVSEARAGDAVAVTSAPARVVELFTSHGCSSCPRADRLLGEMIEADPSLVALEYHVDYWDSLVHGADGSFADPFSDIEWSLRQRGYNGVTLDGRPGVYTPQAIVDGSFAAVGSDRARIEQALAAAPDEQPSLRIERDGNALLIEVDGVTHGERESRRFAQRSQPTPDTGEVSLVRFLRRTVTSITGGENRGRELVNHHVVTAVEPLGRVAADGSLTARAVASDDPAHGCAVLVRHGEARARLAGALCPDPA